MILRSLRRLASFVSLALAPLVLAPSLAFASGWSNGIGSHTSGWQISGNLPSLWLPLTSSLTPLRGGATATFTRADPADGTERK